MKKRGPLLEKIFKTRKAAETAARAEKRKRPGALVRCWPREANGCIFEGMDPENPAPADWCVEVWNFGDWVLGYFPAGFTLENAAETLADLFDRDFVKKTILKRRQTKGTETAKRRGQSRREKIRAELRALMAEGHKKYLAQEMLAEKRRGKKASSLRTIKRATRDL